MLDDEQEPPYIEHGMNYLLAFIALVSTALLLFHSKLLSRQKHLLQAYAALDHGLNQQQQCLLQILQSQPHQDHHEFHRSLRQMQAIRTLGLNGVDQAHELYASLHEKMLQTPQWDITSFQEGHIHLETARIAYNAAAYAYNNCQRNWLSYWICERMGHEMAPPC